ncbi:hypothetical protein AMTR_s00071p00031960 [Amborella trichopoda]|uniref:Uncharacterized protein n=1 Tax=Amborella trichopoda TaxID=13333 RepID=U5DBF9_AMBTC|nr:hypothetical protein AMTR_s00071p00031960 [Amborella trichopoda]
MVILPDAVMIQILAALPVKSADSRRCRNHGKACYPNATLPLCNTLSLPVFCSLSPRPFRWPGNVLMQVPRTFTILIPIREQCLSIKV